MAVLRALHRSRGYNQLVILQRRHFDVSPKIVGVGMFARFPVEAFVETAIERLHKLAGKDRPWKLMAARFR